MYRVSELFSTLQGEGLHTGLPAYFIRLFGCSVGCPWCDTRYSWDATATRVEPDAPIRAVPGSSHYAELTAEALADRVEHAGDRTAVLTGGEPLEQDLDPLLALFRARGIRTHLETSGTQPLGRERPDWLTVSPKIGMPGERLVVARTVCLANEIKMPVGRERDIATLLDLLQRLADLGFKKTPAVYLQPLSLSSSATDTCIRAARQHGWSVSLQTHRLAGLR